MPSRRRRSRWFVAVAAVLALASIALFSACTPESKAEATTYAGINAIRAEHGLPPLTPDNGLLQIARIRSKDMAAKGYFSHSPPDGCDYVCLMNQYRVPYDYAGENIAWNNWGWTETGDVAVEMWKNSPPHLHNILDCHYERFATGVAKAADGKVYYTMIFEGNRAC